MIISRFLQSSPPESQGVISSVPALFFPPLSRCLFLSLSSHPVLLQLRRRRYGAHLLGVVQSTTAVQEQNRCPANGEHSIKHVRPLPPTITDVQRRTLFWCDKLQLQCNSTGMIGRRRRFRPNISASGSALLTSLHRDFSVGLLFQACLLMPQRRRGVWRWCQTAFPPPVQLSCALFPRFSSMLSVLQPDR